MRDAGPTKAFLLAAGLGTRLRPLTETTPKCLVPVGGRPLLHWWFKILERLEVREVLVNTHHLPDHVRDFVRTRPTSMAINIVHEPELLGSGGTLAANQAFVAGEKDYWIFYADTLIGADLRPLVALHRENQADLTLALFRSPNPSSGGVVEIDQSGAILSFEEKPLHPKSNLVAAGAYLAGPALLHYLTPGFSDLSRDVFPRLMGHARARLLDPVIDLGTPDSYARAQKEWMSFGLND